MAMLMYGNMSDCVLAAHLCFNSYVTSNLFYVQITAKDIQSSSHIYLSDGFPILDESEFHGIPTCRNLGFLRHTSNCVHV